MLGRRRTVRGATHQAESSSLALSFLDLMSGGLRGRVAFVRDFGDAASRGVARCGRGWVWLH